MTAALAVATAVTFIWLGMVLAISFLEAPLKFRAPGVTLPIGLGIGRLVFRALNMAEAGFAVVLVLTLAIAGPGASLLIVGGSAALCLLAQLALIRPWLTRRTDAVLAGSDAPRSRAHHAYIGLELLKVLTLVWTGVCLLGL